MSPTIPTPHPAHTKAQRTHRRSRLAVDRGSINRASIAAVRSSLLTCRLRRARPGVDCPARRHPGGPTAGHGGPGATTASGAWARRAALDPTGNALGTDVPAPAHPSSPQDPRGPQDISRDEDMQRHGVPAGRLLLLHRTKRRTAQTTGDQETRPGRKQGELSDHRGPSPVVLISGSW